MSKAWMLICLVSSVAISDQLGVEVQGSLKAICALDLQGVKCFDFDGERTEAPALNRPFSLFGSDMGFCAQDNDGLHCWQDTDKVSYHYPALGNASHITVSDDQVCGKVGEEFLCEGHPFLPKRASQKYAHQVLVAANGYVCGIRKEGEQQVLECLGQLPNGDKEPLVIERSAEISGLSVQRNNVSFAYASDISRFATHNLDRILTVQGKRIAAKRFYMKMDTRPANSIRSLSVRDGSEAFLIATRLEQTLEFRLSTQLPAPPHMDCYSRVEGETFCINRVDFGEPRRQPETYNKIFSFHGEDRECRFREQGDKILCGERGLLHTDLTEKVFIPVHGEPVSLQNAPASLRSFATVVPITMGRVFRNLAGQIEQNLDPTNALFALDLSRIAMEPLQIDLIQQGPLSFLHRTLITETSKRNIRSLTDYPPSKTLEAISIRTLISSLRNQKTLIHTAEQEAQMAELLGEVGRAEAEGDITQAKVRLLEILRRHEPILSYSTQYHRTQGLGQMVAALKLYLAEGSTP